MGLTTDRTDPGLKEIRSDGQQSVYLVLSEEERAKGFVRPVRTEYKHVGCRPKGPTRPLTEEEHERYDKFGYVCFEPYGPERERGSVTGRFWTEKQLKSGCGGVTTMGRALAETLARQPTFYGGTFCVHCQGHYPIGPDGEFTWDDEGEAKKVGT